LIKDRLKCEIKTLNPPERICSLIVDNMAVRKALYCSKPEDRIYGLSTIKSETIGCYPVAANQLLCFVIHRLSAKFIIPASYHFHKDLNSKIFY
jgi:predicted RNA methylase